MKTKILEMNFFPNETLARLDDGQEISISTTDPDGNHMTLDEFKDIFFNVIQDEIFVDEVEDE